MNPKEFAEQLFLKFQSVNCQADSYNKKSAILCAEFMRNIYNTLQIEYHYYNEVIKEIKLLKI